MRTQIAKTGYLPAEYIPPTFSTRTPPPPFPQVDGGGCYREKFFIFFLNPLSTRSNYTSIFIFFQILARIHRMSGLRIFFLFSRFSHSISTRILFFLFFQIFVLVIQYKLSFRLAYKFRLIFTRLIFVIFSSYQFRLVSALQILHFDSSTLYLFDSSAYYKQTSMLIWVCFMLVLAISRLSDVFSFVLGVVYRLGLK